MDATGQICVFSYSAMHVVIDVIGSLGPGGPLHALSVDGQSFVGPSFTADQHDYAVRCVAGANSLTVRATAALGATVSIAPAGQPAPPRPAQDAAATSTFGENGAVVVRAGPADGPAEEYWIRCLPHDFPPLLVSANDVARPGWYLTDDAFPTAGSPYGHFMMILDDRGAPVWYQRVAAPSVNLTRLSDGSLAWSQLLGFGFGDGSHPNGAIEIHSLDGTLLRNVRAVGSFTDHHDITELPNGDIVIVTYVQRAGVDLTAIGRGTNQTVWDGHLQEIDPAGNVVWTWKSEDHIPVGDTTYPVVFPGVPGVDLVHINSVSLAPDGDLIVSARHTDTVYKIRRNAAGDIVWRVGGRQQRRARSSVIRTTASVGSTTPSCWPTATCACSTTAPTCPAHHALLSTPSTSPNGLPRSCHSRLRRTSTCRSASVASRDLDGDTVITWGGSTNPVFTEIDGQGREIQRLSMGGANPYRVKKLAPTAFDINALRATAGVA